MTQNRRHSPLTWTDHWRVPALSPHQWVRIAEFSVLLDLLGLVETNWSGEATANDYARLEYPMLVAATHWFCGLRLPAASAEDFMLGPPLLSRRQAT